MPYVVMLTVVVPWVYKLECLSLLYICLHNQWVHLIYGIYYKTLQIGNLRSLILYNETKYSLQDFLHRIDLIGRQNNKSLSRNSGKILKFVLSLVVVMKCTAGDNVINIF